MPTPVPLAAYGFSPTPDLARVLFLDRPAPGWLAPTLAGLVIAGLTLLAAALYRHERALGRFEPLAAQDPASLQRTLLGLRPEVAGAIWHLRVGTAEIAAILARWVAAGLVESRAESRLPPLSPVLHLRLRADRQSFGGYERALADELFAEGDEVDTRSLRERYPDGFKPADLVGWPVEKEARRLIDAPGPALLRFLPVLLVLLAPPFQLFSALPGQIAAGVALACWGTAYLLARRYRRRTGGRADLFLALLPCALLAAGFAWATAAGVPALGPGPLVGLALLVAGSSYQVILSMRSRHTAQGVRLRKAIAAARRFLEAELESPTPKLTDDCLGHLIALDLGRRADRWYHRSRWGSSPGPPAGSFGRSGPLLEPGGSSWIRAVWVFAKGVPRPANSAPE